MFSHKIKDYSLHMKVGNMQFEDKEFMNKVVAVPNKDEIYANLLSKLSDNGMENILCN